MSPANGSCPPLQVALLAEGVDRNMLDAVIDEDAEVALLAEGVDRNYSIDRSVLKQISRPPRRGRG